MINKDTKGNVNTVLWVLILILLDQGIKLIVKGYYGVYIKIIDDLIYFKPFLNDKYSWMNSMLNLGIGRNLHVVLVLITLTLAYYGFKYYYNKRGRNKIVKLVEIFLFSGGLCSLIDKCFWNGSLDYIMIKNFFIFDLKDIYITIFEVIVVFCAIKDWEDVLKLDEKKIVKDYFKFIKEDLLIK
ncbi:signal peptidase [Clostridium putrefaciens]|uniref:Signal peptidase n=1 Tax=Clostridium putrefaciens TaxID=99675 RepID=A0A381J733_9CLOT|nr:signal peptidase II [Clostridium putrefaciens]SUY46793.1 signal peptidase [Clostridium putrefaciens]